MGWLITPPIMERTLWSLIKNILKLVFWEIHINLRVNVQFTRASFGFSRDGEEERKEENRVRLEHLAANEKKRSRWRKSQAWRRKKGHKMTSNICKWGHFILILFLQLEICDYQLQRWKWALATGSLRILSATFNYRQLVRWSDG